MVTAERTKKDDDCESTTYTTEPQFGYINGKIVYIKGVTRTRRSYKGKGNPRYGIKHSVKQREKYNKTRKLKMEKGEWKTNSKTLKESYRSGKIPLPKGGGMIGKKHTQETKRKISILCLGKKRTEEAKEKMSIAKKGNKYWLGKKHSKKSIRKMSETKKRLIRDGKIKNTFKTEEGRLNAMRSNGRNKINKKELKLDKILQKICPNTYKYCGDAREMVSIKGKVPDWININGKKQVILFNGIYWHLWRKQKENPNLTKNEVEIKEKKPYNEFGFDVLFIWEDELESNPQIIEGKIKEFAEVNICK